MTGDTIKILFLSAYPVDSGQRLRVDQEIREVEEQLRGGSARVRFAVKSAFAVRMPDLQRALLREQPQIVHFSGHGEEGKGIILEDDWGAPKPFAGEALAGLFRLLQGTVRVLVLNACESEEVAMLCRGIIDYTISMRREITDRAAIDFASAFYCALSEGTSVDTAFELAVERLKVDHPAEADTPSLFARHGILDERQQESTHAHRASPDRAKIDARGAQAGGDLYIVSGDQNWFRKG